MSAWLDGLMLKLFEFATGIRQCPTADLYLNNGCCHHVIMTVYGVCIRSIMRCTWQHVHNASIGSFHVE